MPITQLNMSASLVNPSWNPDHALKRLGGDRQLLLEMAQIFLEEAPSQMQLLSKAVAADNCRDAELAAHRLKGDLGYLHAVEAAECARKLEHAAHKGDLSDVETALAELETNLEAIFTVLRALCEDYPTE